MAAAAQAGKQESFMRSMLVFKMGCQQWLEDYGGDTSGYVYKSVKDEFFRQTVVEEFDSNSSVW